MVITKNRRTRLKWRSAKGVFIARTPSHRFCFIGFALGRSCILRNGIKLSPAQSTPSPKTKLKPTASEPFLRNVSRTMAPIKPTVAPTAVTSAFRRLKNQPRLLAGTISASQSL